MSDKHRVLLLDRQNPALEARLAAAYDLHRLADEADPHAFLTAHGSEFAALVTSAIEGADGALLEALPALRVLSSFGVGLDRIDLATARRHGIAVGYTPDVLNDCVADLAFGLLLDAARSISAADRYVRKGRWKEAPYPLAARVSGKRLGILGLGRIGRAVARRAAGFDMEVRYHNRSPATEAPYAYAPSLTELARWSDFLVVAAAGGPASRHIVNGEVLAALGPQGFIVNVARGSVIDERALIDALREGRIAGAGLDVFEHEPDVPDALLALDNVVLLPHVGSGTNETRQAMADRVFDNLHAFFSSGRLISPAPFD